MFDAPPLARSHFSACGTTRIRARIPMRIEYEPRRRAACEWEPAMKSVRFMGLGRPQISRQPREHHQRKS
jgi:hypothetical protein